MSDREKREIRIHNKSDKPDNIVMKEHKITQDCDNIQKLLPKFLNGYFMYLKSNVLRSHQNISHQKGNSQTRDTSD